jgi:hypothetical protein
MVQKWYLVVKWQYFSTIFFHFWENNAFWKTPIIIFPSIPEGWLATIKNLNKKKILEHGSGLFIGLAL